MNRASTTYFYFILLFSFLLIACKEKRSDVALADKHTKEATVTLPDWGKHKAISVPGSLYSGSTYLSAYSEIYERNPKRKIRLTATVSMRNTSATDTIFIERADYYNTEGKRIAEYLPHPIFVLPMATLELVIHEDDTSGGTGANFIFDWKSTSEIPPHFEAVMISTNGQQGISFLTTGIQR
tara:strand:- start:5212 stop:5757 length:546 start_codon:yes stop_codon:yes gene_type:complete